MKIENKLFPVEFSGMFRLAERHRKWCHLDLFDILVR
jgi:hypothetical protein